MSYINEFNFSEGSVFIVDGDTLHQVQSGVDAVNHLPKDRVLAVKMWLLCVCDEKLGFICIGPRVRHSNHTAVVELPGVFQREQTDVANHAP
jgi:hypothetical protein